MHLAVAIVIKYLMIITSFQRNCEFYFIFSLSVNCMWWILLTLRYWEFHLITARKFGCFWLKLAFIWVIFIVHVYYFRANHLFFFRWIIDFQWKFDVDWVFVDIRQKIIESGRFKVYFYNFIPKNIRIVETWAEKHANFDILVLKLANFDILDLKLLIFW